MALIFASVNDLIANNSVSLFYFCLYREESLFGLTLLLFVLYYNTETSFNYLLRVV